MYCSYRSYRKLTAEVCKLFTGSRNAFVGNTKNVGSESAQPIQFLTGEIQQEFRSSSGCFDPLACNIIKHRDVSLMSDAYDYGQRELSDI